MTAVDPTRMPLFTSSAFLLGQLGSHSAYRFGQLLEPLGINPPQYGTLRLLEANDGRTQQQLCEALGIHRNVMVSVIDALERRGLVERRRHPVDRRAHAVHLLPAGRETITRAGELADRLNAELLAPLEPEDRPRMLAMLQRMSIGNGLTPGVHPGLTVEPGVMPICDPGHT
ncbi:MarR family winged helix-turn-helix transcriptional regulator [Nocardia sp. CDC153]|uniref:MarR family winged helix-turn-helix transcriptional regulator n=1 Tax=Nocardia sp. CDC153 TaxID=3112167 RepID=UPI002DB91106|nr:MarR family winged helix-turn-helix transcriptional regulator [Nocardia sp. CDC153]MEC3958545.1 MarR family winged helix-turn-helix transcriptional regulator [Nocardia sp. CDC153]